jgi:hypothetical protein
LTPSENIETLRQAEADVQWICGLFLEYHEKHAGHIWAWKRSGIGDDIIVGAWLELSLMVRYYQNILQTTKDGQNTKRPWMRKAA